MPSEYGTVADLRQLIANVHDVTPEFVYKVAQNALDLIVQFQQDDVASRSGMMSADEAVAILNMMTHRDTQWELVARDKDDDKAELTYEELIGTAMYYNAKDAEGSDE